MFIGSPVKDVSVATKNGSELTHHGSSAKQTKRWTADVELRSLLGESGVKSNRCRTVTVAVGGGVTVRSINSSPRSLSRSTSDPEARGCGSLHLEGGDRRS